MIDSESDWILNQEERLKQAENKGALIGWICGLVLGGMVGWASCWLGYLCSR